MKSRPSRTSTALSPAGSAPAVLLTVQTPLTGMVMLINSGWMFAFGGGVLCVVKYETAVRPNGAPAVLRIVGCTETAKREPEGSGAAGVEITLLPAAVGLAPAAGRAHGAVCVGDRRVG